jgi:hypothetical protein
VILIGLLLSGCAGTMMPRHLGIRPDEPAAGKDMTGGPADTICEEYKAYSTYAQQLQEAYHSRATQNRWWIYVAGIVGLGTVGASAGLAAAAAATTTIALLSIGGGFATGVTATLDNSDLAQIYTIAAQNIDSAIADADTHLKVSAPEKNRYADQVACKAALDHLHNQVSDARKLLEGSRTNTAQGALQRAAAQQQALQQAAAQFAQTDPSVPTPMITDITSAQTPVRKNTEATLTVSPLGTVQPDDLQIQLPGNPLVQVTGVKGDGDNAWKITFTAPDLPAGGAYDPIVVIKKARKTQNKSGKKLQY